MMNYFQVLPSIAACGSTLWVPAAPALLAVVVAAQVAVFGRDDSNTARHVINCVIDPRPVSLMTPCNVLQRASQFSLT
jgi:hypothetical protein